MSVEQTAHHHQQPRQKPQQSPAEDASKVRYIGGHKEPGQARSDHHRAGEGARESWMCAGYVYQCGEAGSTRAFLLGVLRHAFITIAWVE